MSNICLEIFDWKYVENNAWWLAWGERSNLSNICFKRFCLKICWKLCLEVDELTFWNIIFLKSFCWKYVENYACSLTWGGWKELDGVKRSNYRPPTTFLVNPLRDKKEGFYTVQLFYYFTQRSLGPFYCLLILLSFCHTVFLPYCVFLTYFI